MTIKSANDVVGPPIDAEELACKLLAAERRIIELEDENEHLTKRLRVAMSSLLDRGGA